MRSDMAGDGNQTLIPIGQFSLMTRLTVRALRLYDKLGILVPAHVDPNSGYRYDATDQAGLAAKIGAFRAIDLPLTRSASCSRRRFRRRAPSRSMPRDCGTAATRPSGRCSSCEPTRKE